MKISLIASLIFLASVSFASSTPEVTLEDQLKSLEFENQAPTLVNRDKLYAVQTRFLPLTHKNEVSVGVATNLTGDSFLVTRQVEMGYRFHFSDRWSVAASGAFVFNEFSEAGIRFHDMQGLMPDVTYARTRSDLLATYNVFYGKFRVSSEKVFYFDQYVSMGPGIVELNTGTFGAAVADAGFAFWLGQKGSARVGLKDYFYNEKYSDVVTPTHNVHAHLDLGMVF